MTSLRWSSSSTQRRCEDSPHGACFATASTDVGLKCAGAKVNGRIVPLDYQLKNGEFVEILTANNASPSRDWLNFVKTSKARSKIRAFLKEERREENLQRGKELLEREAKKFGVDPSQVLKPDKLTQAAGRYGFVSGDDLLAAIGFGKVPPRQALSKIIDPKSWKNGGKSLTWPGKNSRCPNPFADRFREYAVGEWTIY